MLGEKESCYQLLSSEKYLLATIDMLVRQSLRMSVEDKPNSWWLGSLRNILLIIIGVIEYDKDFVLDYDGICPNDRYFVKGSFEEEMGKKKNILSKDEFVKIMSNLSLRYQMVEEIDGIGRKYHNDFLDGYAFFDAEAERAIIKILEVMFKDKEGNIEWWMLEEEYGRNFEMGDIVENGLEIDLSTPEALYDYLIDKMKK